MSRSLSLVAQIEPVAVNAMPPNCELLARVYIGDEMYGLLREPKNRGLFLASYAGYWRLDVPALLASFVDGVREYDRVRDWQDGRGASGLPVAEPVDAAPRVGAPDAAHAVASERRRMAKASRRSSTVRQRARAADRSEPRR